MCGGNPRGGLDCFASPDRERLGVPFGQPYPACNGDIAAALGAFCSSRSAIPPARRGVQCTTTPTARAALIATARRDQCMSKTAYCIGLPCTYDVDCPTNEKCNSAENTCVGELALARQRVAQRVIDMTCDPSHRAIEVLAGEAQRLADRDGACDAAASRGPARSSAPTVARCTP